MKRITISVINDLVTDQRLHRMAGTLSDMDAEIFLIGRKLPGSYPVTGMDLKYKRHVMLFKKGPLFYLFYNLRLFFDLLFRKRPDLLISIDLDTLLPNFLVSKIRKIPLLYDSHEYFTEVPELIGRPTVKRIWEMIERLVLPKVVHAITVSQSIATLYKEKYGTAFHVVRNVSHLKEPISDEAFHDQYISKYKIMYQGALNVGRGLEMIIESMRQVSNTIFFIAGDGDIRIDLQRLVRRMKLTDKVIFLGKIPPGTLHKITCQCDFGLSVEEDLGLSYRMALPNKIFDYIQARIPILCSELPEMSSLVLENKIGEVIKDRDPVLLGGQIQEILQDREKIRLWRQNLEKVSMVLCWENEEARLKDVVESVWND